MAGDGKDNILLLLLLVILLFRDDDVLLIGDTGGGGETCNVQLILTLLMLSRELHGATCVGG